MHGETVKNVYTCVSIWHKKKHLILYSQYFIWPLSFAIPTPVWTVTQTINETVRSDK